MLLILFLNPKGPVTLCNVSFNLSRSALSRNALSRNALSRNALSRSALTDSGYLSSVDVDKHTPLKVNVLSSPMLKQSSKPLIIVCKVQDL